MFAQRALRAPLQVSARAIRPATFRAAAIAPFSTKPAPVQSQKQVAIKNKWFAAPPPPAKYMVSLRLPPNGYHGPLATLRCFAAGNSNIDCSTGSGESRHASARPVLLRQRGRLRVHDHPAPHLRVLEIHTPCTSPTIRRKTFHQQAIKEREGTEVWVEVGHLCIKA